MKLSPSAAFLAGYGASAARFVADTPPPDKRGKTPQSTGVLGRGTVDGTLALFGVAGAPPDSAGPAPWAAHLEQTIAQAGEDAFVRLGRGAGLVWAAGTYKASGDELRAKSAETQARQLLGGIPSGSAGQAAQSLLATLGGLASPTGGNLIVATIRDLLASSTFLGKLDGATAPPSAEANQLLERVLADPDDPGCTLQKDDDTRLAYARALAPTDPVRAGFIQLQLQTSSMSRFDAMPLQKRVEDLLRVHGAKWTPQSLGKPVFRRGFIARVTVDAAAFLARATELYRQAPITELVVSGAKSGLRDLLASPRMKRIRVLVLSDQKLANEDMALLAASPNLDNLLYLDLSKNPIDGAGLETLVKSAKLPRLRIISAVGTKDDPATQPVYDSEGGWVADEVPSIQKALGDRFGWSSEVGGPSEESTYW